MRDQRCSGRPADHDDLVRTVAGLLRDTLGAKPEVDDDVDLVLQHMGQPVFRVHTEQFAVQVLARVAHSVHSRCSAAVETGR